MTYYWLSFADPARHKGEQFLGASIVAADDAKAAVERAWALGINPGGEVRIAKIPRDQLQDFPLDWHNRLVSKVELNTAGHFSEYDLKRRS
jgi:hypothetical protein